MPLYTNLDRIARGLAAHGIGPDDPISSEQLFALDQWHYHGTEAIAAAAHVLGLGPQRRVLDIGAGVGGPARYLAHTTGCHVTALELQPELDAIGVDLTRRAGLADRVTHLCGDALAEPLPDAGFDAVVSFLAIVHIPDRGRLFDGWPVRSAREAAATSKTSACARRSRRATRTDARRIVYANSLTSRPNTPGSGGRRLFGCHRHRPHAGLGAVRQ